MDVVNIPVQECCSIKKKKMEKRKDLFDKIFSITVKPASSKT